MTPKLIWSRVQAPIKSIYYIKVLFLVNTLILEFVLFKQSIDM